MPSSMDRIRRRRKAIATLRELSHNRESVVIVHYSCESFYDRPQGRSPRITSIAARNLSTAQTTSFSIHQLAERRGIAPADIGTQYDMLERSMLDEWFAFVKEHSTCRWLHWNMRDINYGFPAIAHRYSVLQGTPTAIDEGRLFDFPRLLIDVYGTAYANHPRLQSICALNQISMKDFLSGGDEAAAFDAGDYVKLHQSTLRKVDIIANLFGRYEVGSLETNCKWWQPYGTLPYAIGEWLKEHPIASLIMLILGLISLLLSVVAMI